MPTQIGPPTTTTRVKLPESFTNNPALLVHGECVDCGWAAALPEGAIWPSCPVCGCAVFPPEPGTGVRTGYVAMRLEEVRAVRALHQLTEPAISLKHLVSKLVQTASPLIDSRYGPEPSLDNLTGARKRFAELCDEAMAICRGF